MFLQDNDPHHLHQDPNSIYYFGVLGVILIVVLFFAAGKIMNYLDNRYERKNPIKEDSGTASKDERGSGGSGQ